MDGRFTQDAEHAGQLALDHLATVADFTTNPIDYGDAMVGLGYLLGEALASRHSFANQTVCVAFTVEDADYLAKGLLDVIQQAGAEVSVACFWNRRDKPFDVDWLDVAPIVQEYLEPFPSVVDHLVVLKSIISGACVVRTNLLRLLHEIQPIHIHVVAPVMLAGAEMRLSQFMPAEVVERFEYLTFAVDTRKSEDGNVLPGIGGDVYKRLGMQDAFAKNEIMPRLIEERLRAGPTLTSSRRM